MKPQPPKKAVERNWVAKHAQTFCKAAVHRNKKKDYVRTPKHRSRDFGVSFWPMVGNPGPMKGGVHLFTGELVPAV